MDQFKELTGFIRKEINKSLKQLPIPVKPRYLYDPIRYIIRGKGKRLRPILVHLIGRAYKMDPDEIMKIALSIELLHNFTLIHDDIMDNDTLRHGKETIHTKWDNSSAILAGDGVYTIAQIILNKLSGLHSNQVSKYFNDVTLEICEGQALDKEYENNYLTNEEDYLEMVEKKTGALLGASASLPLIQNGNDTLSIKHSNAFGRLLGKGFQIQDDVLEITSDEKVMGKSLESDIFEGKQTIMFIKANNRYRKRWSDLISQSSKTTIKENVSSFLHETGIINEAQHIAKSYFDLSRKSIEKLHCMNKDELFEFIKLIEKRTY